MDYLAPADREEFAAELTACLALVAPAGMDEAARREWLIVAWDTLNYLPADILKSGCRVAREKCDHPSKIVPAIIEATKGSLRLRRETAREMIPEERRIEPKYITPEEASAILVEFGLKRA